MNPADAIQTPTPDTAPAAPFELGLLRCRLSARDLAILRDTTALGLLTAQQVQRLRFAGDDTSPRTQARRCRRSLQRLHDRGLLARLDRRIGGPDAGSGSYLYRPTATGRRLLGMPGAHGGKPRGYDQPSTQKAAHTLATAELAVQLVEAHRTGTIELITWQPEPVSWRTWNGPAGEPHTIRPDAFVIVGRGDWNHLAFLEVDLETEQLATLARKTDAYRRYHATGTEQAQHGAYPRVVYLAPTPDRRAAIARVLHTDTDPLVTIADPADPAAAITTADAHDPQETNQ